MSERKVKVTLHVDGRVIAAYFAGARAALGDRKKPKPSVIRRIREGLRAIIRKAIRVERA